MKIGIVGSRRRNQPEDKLKIVEKVEEIAFIHDDNVEIVSGGCRCGADKFAEEIAQYFAYDITIHRPQYHRDGRVAPFIRNELIAKDSEILIACVAADRKGGTEDTIKKFKKHHPEGKLIIV